MVQREKAKDMNRAKIRAAAESIIRNEGMEKLTMRRLASEAGVSLRTPYNLFGSKTEVLITLIDGAQFEPFQNSPADDDRLQLEILLGTIDQMERFFATDQSFYRAVFHEIMISEHSDARQEGLARTTTVARLLINGALLNQELRPETQAGALSRHLAIVLLSVVGMWASGFFNNHECAAQVKRAWSAVLLEHCTDEARAVLMAGSRAAQVRETEQ